MKEFEQSFQTPNLDGKAFKESGTWRTTTPFPTVGNVCIANPPEYLKPGLPIQFDLLTKINEGGNTHRAVNVKRFERGRRQKLKPKQRDKMKKRKI